MTTNITRTADEVRESFQRVYERVEVAKQDRAESVEVTQQEAFDLFHREPIFDVLTGVRMTEGVDMALIVVGSTGTVMGFPCVVVERISLDNPNE